MQSLVDVANMISKLVIEGPFLDWVNQDKESGNVAEVLIAAVSEMNYWLAVDMQG